MNPVPAPLVPGDMLPPDQISRRAFFVEDWSHSGKFGIQRVGLTQVAAGVSFGRKGRAHAYVLACAAGRGEIFDRRRWRAFEAGSLVITPPKAPQRVRALPGEELVYAFIGFTGDSGGPLPVSSRHPRIEKGNTAAFIGLVEAILGESENEMEASVLKPMLEALSKMIERAIHLEKAESRLAGLWREVGADLAGKWTIAQLCKTAGMSRDTLWRVCKAETGLSPADYVLQLRMFEAEWLLRSENTLNIEGVGLAVGYENAPSFSRAFRRFFHVSPSQVRGKNKSERSEEAPWLRRNEKWPGDVSERQRLARRVNQDPFPRGLGASKSRFSVLNLKEVANLRLATWPGEGEDLPLPRGRQVLQGIPFDLLPGAGEDCLYFPNARTRQCGIPQPGKTRVKLTTNDKAEVEALYLLLVCNYPVFDAQPARFRMEGRNGHLVSRFEPRVLGWHSLSGGGTGDFHLQDWWWRAPVVRNESVRPVLLTRDGDPLNYERYLYICEWMNPEPGEAVDALVVEGAAESTTAFGLIAATALRG